MQMIRPTDQELSHSGGTLGCKGADIWDTVCAAVTGDAEALRELLQREPKLARAEYWYTQPLHYAVREGHTHCVELLLEAGADPTLARSGTHDLATVARDRGHEQTAA